MKVLHKIINSLREYIGEFSDEQLREILSIVYTEMSIRDRNKRGCLCEYRRVESGSEETRLQADTSQEI